MRNPYDWYISPEEYETAAAHGISKKTLEARIRRLGWPKERAITEPPKKLSKFPREIIELARQNEISLSTFYWRVRIGWPPECAAAVPVVDRAECVKRAHDARRKIPVEFAELAKRNGIDRVTFWRRVVQRGWDPMTAATKPPMTRSEAGQIGWQASKETREVINKWIFSRR